MKATLFALLVVTAALALPVIALAADTPTPAASACQAEYLQIGADAFRARYGATEPYAACLAAHGQTATTTHTTTASEPPSPPPATGPAAACKAEYLQIGPDAFKARYGATEAFGACLKAHGATTGDSTTTTTSTEHPPPAPPTGDSKGKQGATAVATVALALCVSEGRSLGKDAFQAKYGTGKDGLAACVKAARTQAQSILAACKASSKGDAFKPCVLAALKGARVR